VGMATVADLATGIAVVVVARAVINHSPKRNS